MKKESVRLKLDTSKELADGSYPISVYFNDGQARRISTGEKSKPDRWDARTCEVVDHRDADRINAETKERLSTAKSILKQMKEENNYSWESFKALYSVRTSKLTFFQFTEDLEKEMIKAGDIGNMKKYKQARQMLKNFYGKDELYFTDINKAFLEKFMDWLKLRRVNGQPLKGNTIHFYFSEIRAICNHAREKGIMTTNPFYHSWHNRTGFDFRGYSETVEPRVMDNAELDAYVEFDIEQYPELKLNWLRYLFMFNARGNSFVDLANIKRTHLKPDIIDYSRQKLKKKQKPIQRTVVLNWIIDELDKLLPEDREYVFGIHNEKITDPVKRYDRVVHQRRTFNNQLKKIGKLLGTKESITSYVARYSAANSIMETSGDIREAQYALGHKSVTTTERYLSSVKDEKMRAIQERYEKVPKHLQV